MEYIIYVMIAGVAFLTGRLTGYSKGFDEGHAEAINETEEAYHIGEKRTQE